MTRPSTPYDTAEYKRKRAALLADNPTCHWCGNEATTADHLVELDRGGSHDEMVPACLPCNSRRGQAYKRKRDAIQNHHRNEALKDKGFAITKPETIFYGNKHMTPTQLSSISESPNQPGLEPTSHDQPRLETVVPDGLASFGADLGGWARDILGIELMPWQIRCLTNQLVHDDDLNLHNRISLVSTARQNGKTVALMTLVGWWLTKMPIIRGKKQLVLSVSHRLDLGVMLFDELAPILEAKFGAKVSHSYGRNSVTMPDGSRWIVRAAGPSVGHGTSPNLIVADEIWDISSEAIDGGLLPAMRAQKSPLLSCWSTAGTENSRAFLKWREQALRMIDQKKTGNLYFAEWSPPPDLDPMNPAAWSWGNPALGHTLTMETITAESENPDRTQFLRASCNLWVASDQGWLNPGLWPSLKFEGDIPDGGTVAIENSVDETRYFGLRAVGLPDGRTAITVEFMVDTYAQVMEHVERLNQNPAIKFAITPSIDLHWPLHLERKKVIVGYGEILKWTDPVRQMIRQKLLVHTGETMLAEHIGRAVAVRSQGSIALSSQRSSGPIELARLAVFAAALTSKPKTGGKPMMVVSNG